MNCDEIWQGSTIRSRKSGAGGVGGGVRGGGLGDSAPPPSLSNHPFPEPHSQAFTKPQERSSVDFPNLLLNKQTSFTKNYEIIAASQTILQPWQSGKLRVMAKLTQCVA